MRGGKRKGCRLKEPMTCMGTGVAGDIAWGGDLTPPRRRSFSLIGPQQSGATLISAHPDSADAGGLLTPGPLRHC